MERRNIMKIYNTLTRKKEEFHPIEEGKVRMYVCGPTVYNLIHIGNARPMIVFDTVRRYFLSKGYDVHYVSNFTDVDDKIIKKAVEEGVSAEEISNRYIAECKKDMETLNILPATANPQATREIDGMIEMISELLKKGSAYVAEDGTVYYRTRSFSEYGKLSHKNIDDLESGHRTISVSGASTKEDPLDFVLWKPKKEGEPYWESPWCQGRPGWHIECSVMAKKYLGDEIDIHAGGEDLIFPHHENEIAQSEAANGCVFARYWMHNAFLQIDGIKMAKSLGNFRTVREITEHYDSQILRFFMLSAHYRTPLNFTPESWQSATASLERIYTAADNLVFHMQNVKNSALSDEETDLLKQTTIFEQKFDDAMEDDFNTADALAAVFEYVRFINQHLTDESSSEFASRLLDILKQLLSICGIEPVRKKELLPEEIEDLIRQRQDARRAKDFARADAIRDELLSKGILLEDTREGVKWKKA